MKLILMALVLLMPVALLGGNGDQLALAGKKGKSFTKVSTVAQRNQTAAKPAAGFVITDPAAPFTFANVAKVRKIKEIKITLTITDGDTAPDEEDEGDLTLALDGIDTGLQLNGFVNNETTEITVKGSPANEAELRAALLADGALEASIIDADDESPQNIIRSSSDDETTLVIKGKQKKK